MKKTIKYIGEARNGHGKFYPGDEFTGNEKDLAPQVACGVAVWVEDVPAAKPAKVKAKKAKKTNPAKRTESN